MSEWQGSGFTFNMKRQGENGVMKSNDFLLMLLDLPWLRRASGRRRAFLVKTIQTSSTTQLSLLSRLAGLGSFVGVRYTRFAHSAHPHCARPRILGVPRILSYGRAQRRQLEGR